MTISFRRYYGREFAHHQEIAQQLGADFYFAHPYSSWERGLNENTNGLVRQYFPKRSDFSKITDADVQRVMDRLNNRPRKTLGYKTPNQVFFKQKPIALTTWVVAHIKVRAWLQL